MEGLAEIQVPKGTIMMKGTAKSQGGQWIGEEPNILQWVN